LKLSNIFDLFKKIESSSPAVSGTPEYIIAGLGNPGEKYAATRHNAGFMALGVFERKCGVKINRLRFNAMCAEAAIAGKKVLLMMPQTFMNASGEAVRAAADYYKIPAENITVICDDINLTPGSMRIRAKGSAGGQKGLNDIIEKLGSDSFPRIRIGVGEKPAGWDLADHVLGKIPACDAELMEPCFENAFKAAELIVGGNTERAMSLYNRTVKPKTEEKPEAKSEVKPEAKPGEKAEV